nr:MULTISPECIES: helix-turn-helix domain-containing protein [Streptomyces]
MRYPDGGGLTAERRAFRERIRLQAGERFAAGEKTAVIAKDLRVSVRSVERWRRAWREGGMDALRSAGPASSPTVTDAQFAVLDPGLADPERARHVGAVLAGLLVRFREVLRVLDHNDLGLGFGMDGTRHPPPSRPSPRHNPAGTPCP